jgi:hypothetical protein
MNNNITWKLTGDGTLTIDGKGDMPNYSETGPWKAYSDMINTVIICDGVTGVGDRAFYNCSNLVSVTIPDSVTSIGSRAFQYCSSLASINIPDSVISIGNRAFYDCTKLIQTEHGVQYVGTWAVDCDSSITEVIWRENVTGIGVSTFQGCSGLTSIIIPDGVTSIGGHAFTYCSNLVSVTIPDSVTIIGSGAFYECSSLTSVKFNVTSGWWYASWLNATSGTSILESDLANETTAATYLTSTYTTYYWKRS